MSLSLKSKSQCCCAAPRSCPATCEMPYILLGSSPLFDRFYLGHTKSTHTRTQTINKGNFCSLPFDTEGQTTTCVWHQNLRCVDRHVSMEPSSTVADLKALYGAGSAAIMIIRFKNERKSRQKARVFMQCLAGKCFRISSASVLCCV